MDLEELINYEEEERERSRRALHKCYSLGLFSPRFFLQDKVQLKETYAVRIDMEIPVKLLLPFYEQILLPVRPFKSAKEFEKRSGISVEELEILFTENRVIPLPVGHLYLYDGLDYLMPILEKKPPTMFRVDYAQEYFAGIRDAVKYEMDAIAELAGRFGDLAKKYGRQSYFNELPRDTEEQLQIESIERYKRLSYLGYNWLARAISRMEDADRVYYQLGLCSSFLSEPFLIGGCSQYSSQVLEVFRGQAFVVRGKKTKLFEESVIEHFPIEIGRVLIMREEKKLKLLFPSNITLSDILELAGDSAFLKARNALREFQLAVENRLSTGDVLSKKAAIDATWNETIETIESMKMTARFYKWYSWSLIMGVVGRLAISLTGFPGLLSLLGVGVALDKIIQPDPSAVSGVDSLSVAIYRLESVFRKTKNEI